MKQAAQELLEPEPFRWNLRLLLPAFAVCALLIAAAVVKFSPSVERPPATVALFAMRGTDTQVHGPSRQPLLRQPDLTGLPTSSSYHLEVVSISGAPVWRGVLPVQKQQPPTALVPPQVAGAYFVRVSLPSGELLREYALELRESN